MAAAGASASGAGKVLALVMVAAGIMAAIDRFGTVLPLPQLLAAVPLLAILAIALGARSLTFRDVIGGPAPGEAPGAAGSTLLSALALVAAPVAIGLGGFSGLVLIGASLGGAAIGRFRIAPALGSGGAVTIAGAVRARYGPLAGALAALAVVCSLLSLLAAEAALAGILVHQMLGLSEGVGRAVAVATATLAALAGGRRAALLMGAALLPVLALAYLAPVAIAASASGTVPLPWIALFDARAYAAPTVMAAPVTILLALLLLIGLAVLPSLAAPISDASRREGTGGFLVGVLVLLAAPAYVVYGRLGGIDPALDPAGLVLHFAAYVAIGTAPALLLAGGLIAASAAAMALGLALLGATLAEDAYARAAERAAPPGRRVFIARLCMIAAALAAFALSGGGFGTAALATLGLSFAAAGLAPVLMLAWNWPAVRSIDISAAIAAGLSFVLLDSMLAMALPGLGRVLGMEIVPTVLGPTGWFGLPVGASGTVGMAVGLVALVALTLARRLPKRGQPAETAAALPPPPAAPSLPDLSSNPGVSRL